MNPWKVSTLFLLVLVGILTAANFVAAHGGDATLIHSCVKENGAMTIVGPNDVCKASERTLDWNQQGASGVSGYQKVENHVDLTAEANTIYPVQVNCPEGKKILGGGAYVQGIQTQIVVLSSSPERGENNDYWNGIFWNTGGAVNNAQFWVIATCATMAP